MLHSILEFGAYLINTWAKKYLKFPINYKLSIYPVMCIRIDRMRIRIQILTRIQDNKITNLI